MATAYLSLGTNLGDRKSHLVQAVALLAERAGTIGALSSLYETEPWGFQSANRFLNIALQLETSRPPLELLAVTRLIEIEMGRVAKSRSGVYEDRVIDIDLLLYEGAIMQTDVLTLPHPHMHERRFVLEPMAEIAPDLIHPLLQKTMKELLEAI
ncbi:MAG: 2-amino-4-hydroxy-6-hydroxymethyldihydropteridine diphosphokinase [Parabacteroides sp.]